MPMDTTGGDNGQMSSNNLGGGGSSGKFSGEHESDCSSVTSDSAPGGGGWVDQATKCKVLRYKLTILVFFWNAKTEVLEVLVQETIATAKMQKSHNNSQWILKLCKRNFRREEKTLINWNKNSKDWKWVEIEFGLKLKLKIVKFQTTQKELSDMSLALDSERYRAERLEGQINDLTELHQVKSKCLSRSGALINCF